MDFNDTPQEAEFRAEARAWLEDNAERKAPGKVYKYRRGEPELIPAARAWEARKFESGFAGIALPTEYGGRGETRLQQIIFAEEEINYLIPPPVFTISHGMAVPTLLTYATEEQKQRYVPATLRGDEIWCQMFSEPVAGSDLAGLRTRSVRDGDDWIINGQKIWTSGAHYADMAILVTRSDPDAPKHKGLTYFFLDMTSPGIEVRPIRQISGYSNFNEVFMTDLRIPDSQRLGDVGQGWQVAITTLMNERVSSGIRPAPDFEDIFDLVRMTELENGPAVADGAVREKLADWYIKAQGVKLIRARLMTALSRGERPGPENSVSKLVSSFRRQEIAHFGMDLLDMGGGMMDPERAPMRAMYQQALLDAPGGRIAAGSDEILRNIISERVLGLPPDIRVDKELPFDQLPSGR
ncbi:MAG: acyl-CoA dehydrogenase [Rhodospirillaceae bacterium]|jgi:alkylation response protein AidB-like acyl-CoA dehydrogenase|nr:acyl-CoA dehydrogenase [Rhodospirillaceae bacterium]MBT4490282.1 acyl-CoA dehydrogenase [Rhodospirillaceae bacterium]MBT5193642.1 acyl-CoA dehydrogenase [Rhodospirillaceae bacterium]MBT5899179.1 acyl-CoA dehydrogenase [Rhodospirillaceae bacterium]MBT6426365.1 acyl-CoA dehydrogenase [Rhodospirillaceae bacterium]